MKFDRHPIKHINEVSKSWGDAKIQFSEYSYRPQELLDERHCFDVDIRIVNDLWLEEELSSLAPGRELACHSLVFQKGKKLHLPMIDLCCSPDYLDVAHSTLEKVLPTFIFVGLKFYASGRSMHAYGSVLLKPKEWIGMMGRLLLANFPERPPVVDSRWVGHRIIGGYSSLRFSCNTQYYLGMPELINPERRVSSSAGLRDDTSKKIRSQNESGVSIMKRQSTNLAF